MGQFPWKRWSGTSEEPAGAFLDRRSAGVQLAEALAERSAELPWGSGPVVPLVLALPRGGVPVAYEVAAAMGADLDVLLVRKLGLPDQPELAMGALGEGGLRVFNEEVISAFGVGADEIDAVVEREQQVLEARAEAYRGQRPPPSTAGRHVLLVDDGLATGATMRAAVAVVRVGGCASAVVAVPVGSPEACDAMGPLVDGIVCLIRPERFSAVGRWYERFAPTPDEEVVSLLEGSRRRRI